MFCERLSFKEKILHISGDSLFTTLYNSVARDLFIGDLLGLTENPDLK